MKFKLFVRIIRYIFTLISTFYLGVIGAILISIGSDGSVTERIGWFFVIGWLVFGIIDQIIVDRIIASSPQLQGMMDTIMTNDNISFAGFPEGEEITFCELPEENVKLVGRCTNSMSGDWSTRLLYEDSYQIFDWNVRFNEQFRPQMCSLKDVEGHENDFLVKCYCNEDGNFNRWHLILLKRTGYIYEDIELDIKSLIDKIKDAYDAEFEDDGHTVVLTQSIEDTEFAVQSIRINNLVPQTSRIEYGNSVVINLENMTITISIEGYNDAGNTALIANYYVEGKIALSSEGIDVNNLRIVER